MDSLASQAPAGEGEAAAPAPEGLPGSECLDWQPPTVGPADLEAMLTTIAWQGAGDDQPVAGAADPATDGAQVDPAVSVAVPGAGPGAECLPDPAMGTVEASLGDGGTRSDDIAAIPALGAIGEAVAVDLNLDRAAAPDIGDLLSGTSAAFSIAPSLPAAGLADPVT